jgi:hypothetical protein
MISKQLSGVARLLAVALAVSSCAWAQYGGGSGGMGGGTYNPGSRSYGNGAKIGAAVGAVAGAGLLFYALHRRHAQVVGCVAPDGKTLTTDKEKRTYQLAGEPVTGGEHLAVSGKKTKGTDGIDELEIFTVKKNLGQCSQQSAMAGQ